MPVTFQPIDPPVELRTPTFRLPVDARRDRFVERMAGAVGEDATRVRVRAFFDEQARVAEALWALFRDPALLPPLSPIALLRHAARAPRYLPLLRLVGRPLREVLARHQLLHVVQLRTFLDAVCQITVQCGADEAEAPFAMGAMDYYFRGTGHVRGGIGQLAHAMADAIRSLGGEVVLPCKVHSIREDAGGYRLNTRAGEVRARAVVSNLLPEATARLLGGSAEQDDVLRRLQRKVEEGWGAAMLYRVVGPGAKLSRGEAHHLELVADERAPMTEGNHVFCSISGEDETDRVPNQPGARTVTISTHVPMRKLLAMPPLAQAAYVGEIQTRMRSTITTLAPELDRDPSLEMSASPRTFARFTGRPEGYVGGVPRRAGLHHYRDMAPTRLRAGFYLCGDTCFPGQSTLAVALSGIKVAERVAGELGAPVTDDVPPRRARG
jgi:phytoene dehydrogenase-like protein